MVESAGAGSTQTDGGGLICDPANPCDCAQCTTTDDCAQGLTCAPGRRRGESCPGSLWVCSSEP